MKFLNTKVMNFDSAFRGLRNPLESWGKSDSYFGLVDTYFCDIDYETTINWIEYLHPELKAEDIDYSSAEFCDIDDWLLENGVLQSNDVVGTAEVAFLGPKDMELAQKLIKAGPEHRKFLRQIFVSVDIEAPIYWWKEFSTYSVGVTANSTSTMHKLASTPITLDCFETGDMALIVEDWQEKDSGWKYNYDTFVLSYIKGLEGLRQKYNETKDKRYWKELVRWLPQSWKQTRTVTMNYENILSICKQRKGHKLIEWEKFIEWAKTLPYAKELLFIDE